MQKNLPLLKTLYLTIVIFAAAGQLHSQARPSLQMNVGFTFPGKSFGGDFVATNDSGISNISPDFVKSNYGTETGIQIIGELRFPFDKNDRFKLLMSGAYSYFNIFRRSFFGTTIENGATIPVTFDNRFSVSTFGLGVEFSPAKFSKKVTPYVNSSFTFNFLSLSLIKNSYSGALFNDAFRIGLMSNGGIIYKLGGEYSVSFNAGYHTSNLFLKSHKESYNDRLIFDQDRLPINDQEGRFYSNLSDPENPPQIVEGNTKNVGWWTFGIGINILLGKSKIK